MWALGWDKPRVIQRGTSRVFWSQLWKVLRSLSVASWLSGPLWPDLNHNSKRATLYGSSVPSTRQLTEQEDSMAISVLTTNGGDL